MTDPYTLTTLETSGAADVQYSPDGKTLYVAKQDGSVDVFDVASQTKLNTWSVGSDLGAMSLSPDGSTLLVVERDPDIGAPTIYEIDTKTGTVAHFTGLAGNAFYDVQFIDSHTAILTGGGSNENSAFDTQTGTFTDITGGLFSSNASTVLTRDGRYTLFAEEGVSNGPLFIYDSVAGKIVAQGDDYQSNNVGFNFGSQAISEKAGMVLQFIYYGSINVYDINLKFKQTINVGEPIGGIAFDKSGQNFFVYLSGSGKVVEYSTQTFQQVDEFDIGSLPNGGGDDENVYGNQISLDSSGRYLTVGPNWRGDTGVRVIDLSARNDIYRGTPGADDFAGGRGDDTYYINNAGDTITEAFDQGNDSVFSTISYTLGDNVERLTLTGNANLSATGNALDNVLTGNSGNNILNGGAGADVMIGGDGSDTYYVDNAGDVVIETQANVVDLVHSTVSYTLSANVERLTLDGTANINATGNALDNVLTGNSGNNSLNGGAGADVMIGGDGSDTYYVDNPGDVVIETQANVVDLVHSTVSYTLSANVERLTLDGTANINATGNALDNVLTGNSGNNSLNGGAGADVMIGGDGSDTYYVDNPGDVVIETQANVVDLVHSTVSYTLSANVERLTLDGTANINATGNALDNVLTGNSGNNSLNGGAGADVMIGGDGSDTYYVDNAGDVVIETQANVVDLVHSTVSYTLSANVERLTLDGTANINATGNALDNVLTGNSGNNSLNGGAGADVMIGGDGSDTYYVDNVGDVVIETQANVVDLVHSTVSYTLSANVERLTLDGTANINATGNALDNVLIGNSGNNTLDGGAGADILIGGAGKDSFRFDTALGASNIDTILDFTVGDDMIQLDHKIFTALGAGALPAADFAVGTAATNSNQHIIYNSATGDIFYDPDGNGSQAAVKFAHITPGTALGAGSFTVG